MGGRRRTPSQPSLAEVHYSGTTLPDGSLQPRWAPAGRKRHRWKANKCEEEGDWGDVPCVSNQGYGSKVEEAHRMVDGREGWRGRDGIEVGTSAEMMMSCKPWASRKTDEGEGEGDECSRV